MYKRFQKRPLSHSQLSSWEYDKDQWYESYILGVKTPPTAEMMAGSRIGNAIGTPESPVPSLQPPGVKEYKLEYEWDGIPMVGYCDHYCPVIIELNENKTSPNSKRWSQKKADLHDQLTMYAMLLNLIDKVEPEEITMYLNFIPLDLIGVTLVTNGQYRRFKTNRTMEDIIRYQQYIKDTLERMDEYIRAKELSPKSRSKPHYNGV